MESAHPAVVHFPVALLITAFLIETLALVVRRPSWHRVSLWNLGLGTAGAATAVITGRMAESVAKHSMEIHEVMELHRRLGYGVLAGAAVLLLWRLWKRDQLEGSLRWAAWLLLLTVCVTLAWGAHLGGRLVYEFGVGGSYGRSGGIKSPFQNPARAALRAPGGQIQGTTTMAYSLEYVEEE